MTVVLRGPESLHERVGSLIGISEWRVLDQADIDAFTDATGGRQWSTDEAERSGGSASSGTPVHGYLILSLAPTLMDSIVELNGFRFGLNYGLDRVRFPAPLPVGTPVRMRLSLDRVRDVDGGVDVYWEITIEARAVPEPVCVAVWIGRYVT